MRSSKLKVRELKKLSEDPDILQEYYDLSFYSNRSNINENFFNLKSYYNFRSSLTITKISFKFARHILQNTDIYGPTEHSMFSIIEPKTQNDALEMFINYPVTSSYNSKIMGNINRDNFYEWFKLKKNIKFEHLIYALSAYLIDGDEFYSILDGDTNLSVNFSGNFNLNTGYASFMIEDIYKNTNFFKSTTLDEIKKKIKNFIELTIKRNKEKEIKALKQLLFSGTSFMIIPTEFEGAYATDKFFHLYSIDVNFLEIFIDHKKFTERIEFAYTTNLNFLNLNQKKEIIDKLINSIDLAFYKKFFKFSNRLLNNTIHSILLKTPKEEKDEIRLYIFTSILNKKELLDLVIKDNQFCLSTNYILNKNLFDLIKNDHELLKEIFVYNNKAHYILSRINKDHPLSKGNYNPEACYGNIWENKCIGCLFYSEKELSLDNRCSKKYKSVIDLDIKHNAEYINGIQPFLTSQLNTLFNNNQNQANQTQSQ